MSREYKVDINRKVDFSGCKEGKHRFIIITRNNTMAYVEEVVRWCPKCGAVVVDMDCDNRTSAGYYRKIQYPEITLKYGFEDYNTKADRYLIVYYNVNEDVIHLSEKTDSFADAVVEVINAVGDNCDLFMKSLKGMENEKDIIDLFNHFSRCTIKEYYKVGGNDE